MVVLRGAQGVDSQKLGPAGRIDLRAIMRHDFIGPDIEALRSVVELSLKRDVVRRGVALDDDGPRICRRKRIGMKETGVLVIEPAVPHRLMTQVSSRLVPTTKGLSPIK